MTDEQYQACERVEHGWLHVDDFLTSLAIAYIRGDGPGVIFNPHSKQAELLNLRRHDDRR